MKTPAITVPFSSLLLGIMLVAVLFFQVTVCVFAGDVKYPVSEIAPELLKNADMVVRLDETVIEITSMTTYSETVHLVYTVLRESALEKSALRVNYDNDTKITRFEGKTYDASGRETKRCRPADIIDQSAVPYGTLYSDDRVRCIQPVASLYPYTVEYEYKRSCRQRMQYPQWRVVDYFNTSVESASLLIRAAIGLTPRYLTVNYPASGTRPVSNSDSSLSWEMHNIPAIVAEPLCPGIGQIAPLVCIAPAQVTIPGQYPELASWKAYGMWVNWLNYDRGILPEQVRTTIGQLTSALPDPLSKLKMVYKYFQENTRYISVQIGIGGYQPADALSVAKNGYGDCKALANYLKALLQCAGIRSHYTLVMAGPYAMPVRTDFPSLQFNHAILCVPLEKDTIWLECTSQTCPFGFLGSFTDDREVLVITPEGGILAHTPSYPAAINRLIRTAVIDLEPTGNVHITSTTEVKGLQYELFEQRLHQTIEEQKKSVRASIALPTVNITQLKYREVEGVTPGIIETLEMTIPDYATFTGNLVFIPLNVFNRASPLPVTDEIRNLPFRPGYGFTDTDSIIIRYPSAFMADNLPEITNAASEFGDYCAKVVRNNNEIVYVRRFAREGEEFPPKEYPAYYSFIRQISKADKNKIVLKR
jgi:hypothetical protein